MLFTPSKTTKDGKREFVAFVPERCGHGGFVAELDRGTTPLVPEGFDTGTLLRAALCSTRVTVIVSQHSEPECHTRAGGASSPLPNGRPTLKLKGLIVPAEPAE